MQKDDIVRYQAGFVGRQFKTRDERIRKGSQVGIVQEMRMAGMLEGAIVQWLVPGKPTQLVNPQALEVIG